MINLKFKKFLSTALTTLFLLSAGGTAAYAQTEGTTTVNGTIQATVVSFTVAASTSFAINPNAAAGSTFVAPTFTLKNTSTAPLAVSIREFKQDPADVNKFVDVNPTQYTDAEWSKLRLAESKGEIALAVVAKTPSEWKALWESSPIYAKAVQDQIANLGYGVYIGEIDPAATVTLTMSGKHGNAFNALVNAKYLVTFVFELA